MTENTPAVPTTAAMPYIGLRPFLETDQQLFFGREAQISALLTQLEEHPFLAVVGSSGSGKSSLVRAGLIPAIREGGRGHEARPPALSALTA